MKILAQISVFFLLGVFLCSCASLTNNEESFDILDFKIKTQEKVSQALTSEDFKKTLSDELFLQYQDASFQEDSELSIFLMTQLKALYPQDIYLEKKYYAELLRVGEIEVAERGFRRLFEKEKSLELGVLLASIMMSQSNRSSAKSILSDLIRKYSQNEEVVLLLGQILVSEKNFKDAEILFTSALERMPKTSSFYYFLGKIKADQEKNEEAIGFYNKALEIKSNDSLSVLGIGVIYEQESDRERATQFYEAYLEKRGPDQMVLVRLTDLFLARQDYKKAQKYLEILQGLNPDDLEIKLKLGILYINAEDYKNAVSVFKELLLAAPESDKLIYYLASLYQQMGEEENAYAEFIKVSKNSEYYLEAQLSLAQILYSRSVSLKSEGRDFIEFINRSAEENLQISFSLKLLLVSYYEERADYKKAISILEDQEEEDGHSVHHDYYLALLYDKNEDYKRARKLIFSLLEKMPTHAHALNYLAYSYLEKEKDFENAHKYLLEAIALSPDDGYIRDTLGYYYYLKGDYKVALLQFQAAYKALGEERAVLNHLGQTYEALNDYSLALSYYKKVYALCGQDEKDKQEREMALKSIENCQLKIKRLPANS